MYGRKLTRKALSYLRLALLIVAASATACKNDQTFGPGEVFATLDEEVVQVSLVGSQTSVIARRNPKSGRYTYRFSDGKSARTCGPAPARDVAVKRTFSVRALEVFDREKVDQLLSLPSDRWIELEVRGIGEQIAPFQLSLLAPKSGTHHERIDALRREFKNGFATDSQLLELLSLSCGKVDH